MSVISDTIEEFIKEMMKRQNGTLELQRNDLAQQFGCAPSQINYVLSTRFSRARGYATESRRGGGGYIRVIRLDLTKSDYIKGVIEKKLQSEINTRQARELAEGLLQTGMIDFREKKIILAAVSDDALATAGEYKNQLRSEILKEVLFSVLSEKQ